MHSNTSLFPHIQKIPNVMGGSACIANTRISVWVLVRSRQLGISDTEILNIYPMLNPTVLTDVWRYADLHQEEIEADIVANEQD